MWSSLPDSASFASLQFFKRTVTTADLTTFSVSDFT